MRERYQSAEEMRGELALLQSGKSVKRRRALGQRWKLARKIAVASAVLALVVASAIALHEVNRNRPLSSDPEAQTLYEQAGYYLKNATLDRTLQAIVGILGSRGERGRVLPSR